MFLTSKRGGYPNSSLNWAQTRNRVKSQDLPPTFPDTFFNPKVGAKFEKCKNVRPNPTSFPRDGHLSTAGRRVIGEVLAKKVLEKGWLGTPVPPQDKVSVQ